MARQVPGEYATAAAEPQSPRTSQGLPADGRSGEANPDARAGRERVEVGIRKFRDSGTQGRPGRARRDKTE